MKISSSSIGMNATRAYSKIEENSSISIMRWGTTDKAKREKGAEVTISEKARENFIKIRQETRKEAQQSLAESQAKRAQGENSVSSVDLSEEDPRIKMLKRILEILKNIRSKGGLSYPSLDSLKSGTKQSNPVQTNQLFQTALSSSMGSNVTFANGTSGVNGVWTKQTVDSTFSSENENTAYTSVGTVMTEDGRSIDFNISLEMSRSFEKSTASWSDEREVAFCDPLVINMGSDVAQVSDQKFYFDLDSDGSEEEISELGSGSGYLAYDKNGDGEINDGSELFGTKSGDGFADLAAYDEDGNGWIDENDDIFSKLKVWTKDDNGNNQLLNLKSADVGAIYLGKASTEFAMKNQETNATNAKIRSTGIYLKESGGVSTVQHVDLAV